MGGALVLVFASVTTTPVGKGGRPLSYAVLLLLHLCKHGELSKDFAFCV